MPRYIVQSETPITARELEGGTPEHPWVPGGGRPTLPPGWERPEIPPIPPRDEWPPLPPGLEDFLRPGVGLPIPPTPEHPIVPLPDEEIDPPGIWPPIRPDFPDLSGKSLALALIYVSRHVAKWHWVVIDHEEAKEKFDKAKQAIKDKIPAGGAGGRPPQRPEPHR